MRRLVIRVLPCAFLGEEAVDAESWRRYAESACEIEQFTFADEWWRWEAPTG